MAWKEIPEHPGLFAQRNGMIARRKPDGLELAKQSVISSGYLGVSVYCGDKLRTRLVRRLVLQAFVGPCPKGMEARHLNDDPFDNRLCNLVWGTRAENIEDRYRNGRGNDGESNYKTRLKTPQVLSLRSRHAAGENLKQLAKEFGIIYKNAWKIIKRHVWARV